jgi:hypothetical protein
MKVGAFVASRLPDGTANTAESACDQPAERFRESLPASKTLKAEGARHRAWESAPSGAVIKQSAASQHLLQHRGRAVVFASLEDLAARVDDPALDIGPDDVMVLQMLGRSAAQGCQAGYLPIPKSPGQRVRTWCGFRMPA